MTEEKETLKNQQQWQEQIGRPIAARTMNKNEIMQFRDVLAASYGIKGEEVFFDFEKIKNENDEDRDDCLLLKYSMMVMVKKNYEKRNIFIIKVPIPEELRMRAEQMRRQGASTTGRSRNLKKLALPAPEIEKKAKPVIIKPIRRKPVEEIS